MLVQRKYLGQLSGIPFQINEITLHRNYFNGQFDYCWKYWARRAALSNHRWQNSKSVHWNNIKLNELCILQKLHFMMSDNVCPHQYLPQLKLEIRKANMQIKMGTWFWNKTVMNIIPSIHLFIIDHASNITQLTLIILDSGVLSYKWCSTS